MALTDGRTQSKGDKTTEGFSNTSASRLGRQRTLCCPLSALWLGHSLGEGLGGLKGLCREIWIRITSKTTVPGEEMWPPQGDQTRDGYFLVRKWKTAKLCPQMQLNNPAPSVIQPGGTTYLWWADVKCGVVLGSWTTPLAPVGPRVAIVGPSSIWVLSRDCTMLMASCFRTFTGVWHVPQVSLFDRSWCRSLSGMNNFSSILANKSASCELKQGKIIKQRLTDIMF